MNIENHKSDLNQNFFIRHVWTYRNFLLLIIIGAMINNLDHSAALYMKISDRVSLTQAYSVVIIFDLIVIALIWVGDSKAILFAISVFFINELAWDAVDIFYQIGRKTLDINYTLDEPMREYLGLIEKAVTMLIYGGTFAYTVHHFSYLFKKQLIKETKFNGMVMKLRKYLAELAAENSKLSRSLAEQSAGVAEGQQKLAEAQQRLLAREEKLSALEQQLKNEAAELDELRKFKSAKEAELTCVCGKRFEDMGAKFGHQRKCDLHKKQVHRSDKA